MSREIINGKYDFEYLPTGLKVLQAVNDFIPNILFVGGFGCGKTRQLSEIGWNLGFKYKKLSVGHFRKTRVSIKDTAYKDFLADIVPPEYIVNHNKSNLEIIIGGGSQYFFYGIDKFNRKGSYKFDIIIVHEAIELEMDDIIMLQGRLRGKVIPVPLFMLETNAGYPKSPLHNLFIVNENKKKLPAEEIGVYNKKYILGRAYKKTKDYQRIEDKIKNQGFRDPDYVSYTADSYENYHNPDSYFDRLDKWKGTQYHNRFVLAQWTAFEGLVYTMFNIDIHVIKPFAIPESWKKYIVIDFGFEHPLFIGWIAEDPITGIEYLYRQFYMTRQLIRNATKRCKKITEDAGEEIEEAIGDHDAEGRAQFEEDWIEVEPAIKTVNEGIQDVAESLLERSTDKKRGFYIFDNDWSGEPGYNYGLIEEDPILVERNEPTCVQEEFPIYLWGKDDKPIKKCDHGLDGIRYGRHTIRKRDLEMTTTGISESGRPSRR